MGRRFVVGVAALAFMSGAACDRSSGEGETAPSAAHTDERSTPTFPSVESASPQGDGSTAAAAPPSSTPTGSAAPAPSGRAEPTGDGGPSSTNTADAAVQKVTFDDPVGDATGGIGASPTWADLAGGSLERQGNAYRLIVRLGGDAPETSPRPKTMNIATYFDLNGDGAVDREIWVNLGPNGWGPAVYDNEGHATPGRASNVSVVEEGGNVRILFPDVTLGRPIRLRFSVASEYGDVTALGGTTTRRDDAPDNDRPVSFP
jgi:hypothetical protein